VQGQRGDQGLGTSSRPATTASGPRLRGLQLHLLSRNANNSVRVTDEFHALRFESDGPFTTRTVKGPRAGPRVPAHRDLMHKIAEATWKCGDPGNAVRHHHQTSGHTSKKHGPHQTLRTRASEYMFLDDSACNLASFNLLKFVTPGGQFDIAAYRYAIAHRHHRDGDHRGTRRATHRDDRAQLARLPAAGPGLRQTWARFLIGLRPALRLRRRARLRRHADRHPLRRRVLAVGRRIAETCAPLGAATHITQQSEITGGACPGFYVKPRAIPGRHPHATAPKSNKHRKPTITSPRHYAKSRSTFRNWSKLIAASRHAWGRKPSPTEKTGYRNSQVTVARAHRNHRLS